jgi:hypothetical protein
MQPLQNPLEIKHREAVDSHYITPSMRKEIKNYMQSSAVPLFKKAN